MNVLNVFEGMGVGKLALNETNINVNNYFSSEIDKYASGVSKFLHYDSIQLGDIRQWQKWNLSQIDLLMGGSPCQGFSFAGKQKGMSTNCKIEITTLEQYRQLKSEGFEFNGQSYLFWEYVDILTTLKPKYFLLENVVMAKKWQNIITQVLGVEPIMINSSLVSAQNRRRLYWCNWHVEQPEDCGILLKDIIESQFNGAIIKNRDELQERNDKSICIDVNYHKGADNHGQRTQVVIHPCELRDNIPTGECHHVAYINPQLTYRKLTPIECERLQTVHDDSTRWGIINNQYVEISNSQRYKMLGNGWNKDTIVHILKSMPI